MTEPRHREQPAWQQALAGALVEALPRLLQEQPEPLLEELIVALTEALCRGDDGLDLAAEAPDGVNAALWPAAHRQALVASALAQDPCGPLQLVGTRLGWRRWQQRRQAVLAALIARAAEALPSPEPVPGSAEREEVDLADLDSAQRRAVRTALERQLTLILGGPGTGKTSTVARLLQFWQRRQPDLRLHLAAPTGKAAARLRAASGDRLPCSTLHRLLESRGEQFARNRHQPLALDLLVVDEVSMVDLELMEALLEALPSSCRLVLVGDPAQLPPIAPAPLLSLLQEPAAAAALAAVRIELGTTYRNAGAIARVASALRTQLQRPAATAASLTDPLVTHPLVTRPLVTGSLAPGSSTPDSPVPGSPVPNSTAPTSPAPDDSATDRAATDRAANNRAATDRAATDRSAADDPAGGCPTADVLSRLRPLLLELRPEDNLSWRQAPPGRLPPVLLRRLQEHRRRLAQLAEGCWPGHEQGWQELRAERDRLLVLSPRRRGRWGIEAIHRSLLAGPGPGGVRGGGAASWPQGTPLLCRRNLPELGLANGDIGILVSRHDGAAGRESRVLFGQEEPLWLHPAQLVGALEPALALTVHKAQGSEADAVIVLLEDAAEADPRLLYTALTRARQQALLITASLPAAQTQT